MPLTSSQRELLTTAICETFDERSLGQFVFFSMGIDPDSVGRNLPFNEFASEFVTRIEQKGLTEKLLATLVEEHPQESRFQQLASQTSQPAEASKTESTSAANRTPDRPPIRLYSTLASSNRGEITVLAIVETLLSVALYVGIAYWFDTVRHIVIAAVLAPFWLLRTKGSVKPRPARIGGQVA